MFGDQLNDNMILGIGTDIVDTRRIQAAMQRHPDRFVKTCFTDTEIEQSQNQASYFAKRFAVKEAVYKSLGVKGCNWREAETVSAPNGAPQVTLTGRCKTALESMTPPGYEANLCVSISDEPPYAMAFVVIGAEQC